MDNVFFFLFPWEYYATGTDQLRFSNRLYILPEAEALKSVKSAPITITPQSVWATGTEAIVVQ